MFGDQIAEKKHGSVEFVDCQAAQDRHLEDSNFEGVEAGEFAVVFKNVNLRNLFAHLDQLAPLLMSQQALQVGNQTLEILHHDFEVLVHDAPPALPLLRSPLGRLLDVQPFFLLSLLISAAAGGQTHKQI